MLRSLGPRLRTGVVGNLGVQIGSQMLQIGIQIGMVPILIYAWGLTRYGTWILLFTIPGYLSLADFGLSRVSANIMAARMARGDQTGVIAGYQVLWLTSISVFVLLFAAAGMFLMLDPSSVNFAQSVTDGHAIMVVMLLVAYGLFNLLTGIIYSGFRTLNQYVGVGWAVIVIWTIESGSAAVLALLGYGIIAVAVSYFLIHTSGLIVLAIALRLRAPWLMTRRLVVRRANFAEIVRPALASMTLPAANALVIQGTVVALAGGLGVATVPIFSTFRTLTRLPVQLSLIASNAALPAITLADAVADRSRQAFLFTCIVLLGSIILIPGFIAVMLFGPAIIHIWTNGHIITPYGFAIILALGMIPSALWQQTANFLTAVNRHALYGYFYLIAGGVAVAATAMLSHYGSLSLAVVPMVVLDYVMLAWLLLMGRRLGLISRQTLMLGRNETWTRLAIIRSSILRNRSKSYE